MSDITRVTYRWDDQPGTQPGWYCESYGENGRLAADSQKVWYPVSVDAYGEDDEASLIEALQEAFPGAAIVPG